MIKAVIFDMDGVLVDATEWHYEALNKALTLVGYEIERHEHQERYNALPTKKKLKLLSVEKALPESLHSFVYKVKQKYTMDIIFEKCKPDFEKEYMLSKLKDNGYALAVCSNSIKQSVEIMLGKTHLMPYIDLYLSNEDVEKPKPSPEMYLKAFEKIGVKPSEALIIEDAGPGIQAAKDSGGHVCEVKGFEDVCLNLIKECIDRRKK